MTGENTLPSAVTTDPDRGPAVFAVSWIECILAILFVIARMFTRSRLIHNVGSDDWLMVATLVLAVICQAFITAGTHYGTGRHLDTITPNDRVVALKMNYLSQCFALASICVGKISVSYLLFRIMGPTRSKARAWFLWILMVLLITINIATVGIIFGQCSPTRKLWQPSISGHCLSPSVQPDYSYFQGSFSALSDLTLALFPIVIIWNLQMKLAVKIGIGSAMGLGVFAAAAAIVKTYELRLLNAKSDFTYETVGLVIWFSTEMYVIIIAACVPTLRPLLPLLHGHLPSSRNSKSRNRETYTQVLKQDRKGFHTHEDEDAHDLPFMQPSPTYKDPYHSNDNHLESQTESTLQRGAGSEEYPIPDSCKIMKTNRVDVTTRNKLSNENVAKFKHLSLTTR